MSDAPEDPTSGQPPSEELGADLPKEAGRRLEELEHGLVHLRPLRERIPPDQGGRASTRSAS